MSYNRIYNFSAGPAMMPVPVLEEMQRDLVALPGVGMSILEISHRSKAFEAILARDRGRHPGAGRRPRELSRVVSAGRRQPAVLHGADELSGLVGDRRLHRRRIVGGEGDQGSEKSRDGQRRGQHEGRRLHAHPGTGRVEAHARRRVRAHDVEQHHRRHRVQAAARRGRRAARQRHVIGHVQPPARGRPVTP